ncbi:MAG TPA: glycosyltransferase family 2 protein [Blastocatellia bacterium]|nr:glycosyltransferase family 2 protein [Blastocatellia bacterium]HMX24143.1 glycosyltransferase family 2 protein [Blastocatellia bacterium]HMY70862.1 glycosyltransferase family 2 protein [Blastocatellia bacterium]HMZ20905.1 glycosyltransferase family 2 protein [Blastocatellia bacterium]HNG30778.1 glycosyltransferase family 2 protein [Blastocatellia bacterium]
MKYSIVVPFHNEEENLPELYRRLTRVMEALGDDYELVFVDDGSTDKTHQLLRDICALDPRVVGVRLRRNFGQTPALAAGFDCAMGEIVIPMDGDLQHEPEDIPRLVAKLEEGYDIVSGWRQNRQDGFLRTFPSKIANKLMAKASGVKIHDFGTTFKAYRREVLERIPIYGQMHRFIPAMASIEGALIAEVPIEDKPRASGKSHYGLSRTFRVMFDILTIRFIVRYLSRPLHFFGSIGAAMIVVATLLASWLLLKKLLLRGDIFIENGPMLLFAAVTFLAGLQFLGFGLLGDLLARLYYAPERRDIYNVARIYRAELPKENFEENQR